MVFRILTVMYYSFVGQTVILFRFNFSKVGNSNNHLLIAKKLYLSSQILSDMVPLNYDELKWMITH